MTTPTRIAPCTAHPAALQRSTTISVAAVAKHPTSLYSPHFGA